MLFSSRNIFSLPSVSWHLFEKWLWTKLNVTYFPAFTTWTHWNSLFKRHSTTRQQVNLRLMLSHGQTPHQQQTAADGCCTFPRPLLLTVIYVSRSWMGVASSHWGLLLGGVSAADAESSLCACSHTRARRAARSQPAAGWALSRRSGSWPGFCSWAEQPESAVSPQSLLPLLCHALSWRLWKSCWLLSKVLFHVQIQIQFAFEGKWKDVLILVDTFGQNTLSEFEN